MKYICQKKCFHKNHLFEKGHAFEAAPGEKVPDYFVKLDENTKPELVAQEEEITFKSLAETAALKPESGAYVTHSKEEIDDNSPKENPSKGNRR